MSDAIQKALARRAVLQEQIDMIDSFLDLHRRIFGEKAEENAAFGDVLKAEVVPASNGETVRPMNDPHAIADAIGKILSDASDPMTRGQIRKALALNGVTIHSKDVSKYLGTLIWRNQNRFINIEGEGYWLKARSLPDRILRKDKRFQ